MAESVEQLETYINMNGFPILRRCANCIFFSHQHSHPNSNPDYEATFEKMRLGYCTFKPFHFAYTLEPNLYAITKDFYLCENHKLHNEEKLEQVSEKVILKYCLKKKEDIL
jgi:hypothetical protein